LEINPKHPLIAALAARVGQTDKEALGDAIWLIFDAARLMDGEKLADAPEFAARLTRVLRKAVGEPDVT
ncbi:MAG: molecular chaperone HtpG, partial [Methylovirgula sp.]